MNRWINSELYKPPAATIQHSTETYESISSTVRVPHVSAKLAPSPTCVPNYKRQKIPRNLNTVIPCVLNCHYIDAYWMRLIFLVVGHCWCPHQERLASSSSDATPGLETPGLLWRTLRQRSLLLRRWSEVQLRGSVERVQYWSTLKVLRGGREEKSGAYAMKRVVTGVHLPTP